MAEDLLHFEDFPTGKVSEYGAYNVTEAEIVDFAAKYDPQPVHLDSLTAKKHMLGGLCASGWHTCAMVMRMNCDGFLLRAASMGGPGIAEVKWMKPVRPGDVLRVRQTVLETRTSKSRPEMGLADMTNEIFNQAGEKVMSRKGFVMLRRRRADPMPTRDMAATKPAARVGPEAVWDDRGDAGLARHYEDVVVGARRSVGSHTFSAEDIVAFARRWDPQPFHLDEEAGRRSHFGGLVASGWHTAAVFMGAFIRRYQREVAELTARAIAVPQVGPSPGFRDLRWPRPTYAGDTLTFTTQVIGKRIAGSRPGWGLVFARNTGVNQRGEVAYEFTSSAFWPRHG